MIPTHTRLQVIKLNCVSCGSTLDISEQMNKLACGYCGTQQIVERSGGAIHLRGVAEALSKVQVGTDKTAAELAIARLTKELEALHYHRAQKEQNWLNIRTQRLYEWNAFLQDKKSKVNTFTTLAAIIGAIPSGVIASVISKFISNTNNAVWFIVFFILIATLTAAFLVRSKIQANDKYNPSKLQEDCNKEFANLDKQITKDLGETDKLIAALNAKIQQNYQIANS